MVGSTPIMCVIYQAREREKEVRVNFWWVHIALTYANI